MQVDILIRSSLAARFAGAVLVVAATVPTQRVPDVRLNTNSAGTSNSEGPQIASVGSMVFAAWQDDRSGNWDVYFTRSIDGGMSWQAPDVRLDTDASGTAQSLAPQMVTSGKSVFVTWHDDRNGNSDLYFNRSLDGGATWLPADVRLDTDGAGSAASINPQIAVSDSSIFVVWHDYRNGSLDIYFNRSLDDGTTWLPSDVRLDTDPPGSANSSEAQIASAGSSVYVTWEDDRNGSTDIYLNRSLDDGATWLSSDLRPNTDPPGAATSSQPQISVFGTSVHVVWSDARNGNSDIYFNTSQNAGASWLLSDVRLNTDPAGSAQSREPVMALSGSSLYVTWQDSRSGVDGIYFNRSSDGGQSWLASDRRLDTGLGGSFRPALAVSSPTIFVSWTNTRNGNQDVYINRSLDDGTTWLPAETRLDTDLPGAHASSRQQIGVSGSIVNVAWQDGRNGKNDIYVNVPFGFHAYGPNLTGSGGAAPVLAGMGRPTIGDAISMEVTNGLGGAPGAFLLGTQKTFAPVMGGTLLVVPIVHAPVTLSGTSGSPGSGTGSLPLSIPNSPALVGMSLNVQAIFFDAGAVFGLSMSTGLEVWIG